MASTISTVMVAVAERPGDLALGPLHRLFVGLDAVASDVVLATWAKQTGCR